MTDKILPIPCTKVDGKTVKDWFQEINKELDELKEVVLCWLYLNDDAVHAKKIYALEQKRKIAEEAVDTVTAITSMLETMGVDENMRQEAQKRINERNRKRGRF